MKKWLHARDPNGKWYLRAPLKIYHYLRRILSPPDKNLIMARRAVRHMKLVSGPTPKLTYLHRDFPKTIPTQLELVHGGAVKYTYLNRTWPQAGAECNLLYGVSSAQSTLAGNIVKEARERGIKLVWNQNGVWVPEAYPPQMVEQGNRIMAELLHSADHVFYQSQFCKRSADHFLGSRGHDFEVLYNAVDTEHFSPGNKLGRNDLVLLIAGSHIVPYRVPTALHTLSFVCKEMPGTRLLIAGQVMHMETIEGLIQELGLSRFVEFLPPYTQEEAPEIYRKCDILLHTKYNDPCPTVVIEAMSCGLPVVYSKTGGVPELVGDNAGYGVDSPSDWYMVHPPDPKKMGEGVLRVASDLKRFSAAARERAVSNFDYRPWLKRHAEVFARLLEG